MTEWTSYQDNPPAALQQIWARTDTGEILALANYRDAVDGNDSTKHITHWQPLDEEMYRRGELPEAIRPHCVNK